MKISGLYFTGIFLLSATAFADTYGTKTSTNTDTGKTITDTFTSTDVAKGVETVEFKTGGKMLSSHEKSELEDLIKKTGTHDMTAKVYVWADQKYAVDGKKAPSSAIKLASDRADSIKKYLKDSLKVDSVSIFNMAKEPSVWQKMFKTESYDVKTSGNVTKDTDTNTIEHSQLTADRGGPSKAVVMIVTKGSK